MNKKGVTPLLATFLLIIFAMLLGSVIMGFGKSYIEGAAPADTTPIPQACRTDTPATPLQTLQIRHINGDISEEEYYILEKQLG